MKNYCKKKARILLNRKEHFIYLLSQKEDIMAQVNEDIFYNVVELLIDGNQKVNEFEGLVKFLKKNILEEKDKLCDVLNRIEDISYHPLKTLQIEITNQCNFRCKHCYVGEKSVIEYLDFELIKNIVDDAKKLGVCKIAITGGEPILHPQFIQIIEYIKSKEISLDIYTNAYLLNGELYDKFSKCGVNTVRLSVDGCNSVDHDWLRNQGGSFNKNLLAIKELKKRNINVIVTCILNKNNYSKILEIKKFFERLEIGYKFDYLINEGNAKNIYENICISEEMYSSHLAKILTMDTDKTKMSSIKKKRFCGAGVEFAYLDSFGNLKVCPSIPSEVVCYGNVMTDGLYDIWVNNYHLYSYLGCNKACSCKYDDVCCGGCRSRAFTMHHDINAPDTVMCRLLEQIDKGV